MKGIPGWRFDKIKDPSFQFIEESHEYLLNGERLWSPTSAFKQVRWVDDTYYTDEHRYRGQYVHWIRRLDDENDLDIKDVAPEYLGFLEAYYAVKALWKIVPRMGERPLYHPDLRYGVTPDSECLILDGDPAIVEYKSGEPGSGPPPWWTAIQTLSQELAVSAFDPIGRIIVRRRVGVKLFRNGKFKAVEYTDYDTDFHKWLQCLGTCKAPPGARGLPPRKQAITASL
jgi:hypothetical protein